jgi:hypothetical protein
VVGGIIFLAMAAGIMVLFVLPFFRRNPPRSKSNEDGERNALPLSTVRFEDTSSNHHQQF